MPGGAWGFAGGGNSSPKPQEERGRKISITILIVVLAGIACWAFVHYVCPVLFFD
jgi:hypothetical protein